LAPADWKYQSIAAVVLPSQESESLLAGNPSPLNIVTTTDGMQMVASCGSRGYYLQLNYKTDPKDTPVGRLIQVKWCPNCTNLYSS
jgi:hypothetical protein